MVSVQCVSVVDLSILIVIVHPFVVAWCMVILCLSAVVVVPILLQLYDRLPFRKKILSFQIEALSQGTQGEVHMSYTVWRII